jgi:hypothetical protein
LRLALIVYPHDDDIRALHRPVRGKAKAQPSARFCMHFKANVVRLNGTGCPKYRRENAVRRSKSGRVNEGVVYRKQEVTKPDIIKSLILVIFI